MHMDQVPAVNPWMGLVEGNNINIYSLSRSVIHKAAVERNIYIYI